LNTTSGQLTQEFTDDHDKLAKALLGILPRSVMSHSARDCPDVTYYQADLILNKSQQQALDVATEEALQCAFNRRPPHARPGAQALAMSTASNILAQGDSETQFAYRHLDDGRKAFGEHAWPARAGARFPGFITSTMQAEASEMVDRATRSKHRD